MADPIRLYRPSNGTEGVAFMARFCECCERDAAMREYGEEGCPIVAMALCVDVDDPDYPREWRHSATGPICAAFVPEGVPLPPEVSPDQMALPIGEVACRC